MVLGSSRVAASITASTRHTNAKARQAATAQPKPWPARRRVTANHSSPMAGAIPGHRRPAFAAAGGPARRWITALAGTPASTPRSPAPTAVAKLLIRQSLACGRLPTFCAGRHGGDCPHLRLSLRARQRSTTPWSSPSSEGVMWTHRRRLAVIAQAIWPPAGNGLAGGAGATSGPLPLAADRPCSQPPGHGPRHHRAAARALCVPPGLPAAALDPGPGGAGRRPRRPPGRPAAGRPAASTPPRPTPRFRRNQGVA